MTERQKEHQATDTDLQTTGLSTADMAAAARGQAAASESETKQVLEDAVPVESTPAAPSMPSVQDRGAAQSTPLLVADETHTFRSRWDSIQTGFVDEPRRSVEQADGLVAEVMKRLAETFAEERSKLEGQWSRGDNVSTEDLRLALQRYRSFFDRLLSM
jgi:hypothetical protein